MSNTHPYNWQGLCVEMSRLIQLGLDHGWCSYPDKSPVVVPWPDGHQSARDNGQRFETVQAHGCHQCGATWFDGLHVCPSCGSDNVATTYTKNV